MFRFVLFYFNFKTLPWYDAWHYYIVSATGHASSSDPGHQRIVAAEFQRGSRVSLLGRVRCGGAVRGALVLGRVLVSRSGRMHRVCAVHLRSVMS